MIVGGQTSARALTIIDYHQLSLTIMRRLTRDLVLSVFQNTKPSAYYQTTGLKAVGSVGLGCFGLNVFRNKKEAE